MTEQFTKRGYNKFAEMYHVKRIKGNNFYNKYIENPAMEKFLKNEVKGRKVLDLGCGSGISTKRLHNFGAKVKGVDLSKNLIEIAKKDNPNIEFYASTGKKTPFHKNEFNIVSSGLMVHYIENLNTLFKEVSRILKKNGSFVFSLNHPVREVLESIKVGKKKYRYLDRYFVRRGAKWRFEEGMEVITYHHTFEDIINSLNDNGFVTERLIETRSKKGSKKYAPNPYEDGMNNPTFIVIKARKIK
jgi:ubiquinone/menaquinone biosynthesis C-methylase UbiE